jgi:hypothetical protein
MPDLVEVAREHEDDSVRLLTVSYDLQIAGAPKPDVAVANMQRFLKARGWSFPVYVFDAPGLDAINERFDLPGPIPVTLAFDAKGQLVDREDGPSSKARFDELMKKALGK